jgi:hypothetical protein
MRVSIRGWRGQPSWLRYYAVPLAKHYHRIECPLAGDSVPVSHEEAQARKLTPCKLCKPTPI